MKYQVLTKNSKKEKINIMIQELVVRLQTQNIVASWKTFLIIIPSFSAKLTIHILKYLQLHWLLHQL